LKLCKPGPLRIDSPSGVGLNFGCGDELSPGNSSTTETPVRTSLLAGVFLLLAESSRLEFERGGICQTNLTTSQGPGQTDDTGRVFLFGAVRQTKKPATRSMRKSATFTKSTSGRVTAPKSIACFMRAAISGRRSKSWLPKSNAGRAYASPFDSGRECYGGGHPNENAPARRTGASSGPYT
jgi:hypothetical protein